MTTIYSLPRNPAARVPGLINARVIHLVL
jgi:hypothetical protein